MQDLKNYMGYPSKASLFKLQNVIEKELGNNLFYIAALCNIVDISMYDVLEGIRKNAHPWNLQSVLNKHKTL